MNRLTLQVNNLVGKSVNCRCISLKLTFSSKCSACIHYNISSLSFVLVIFTRCDARSWTTPNLSAWLSEYFLVLREYLSSTNKYKVRVSHTPKIFPFLGHSRCRAKNIRTSRICLTQCTGKSNAKFQQWLLGNLLSVYHAWIILSSGIWTCLCGWTVSNIHSFTLILTCLWTRKHILTWALTFQDMTFHSITFCGMTSQNSVIHNITKHNITIF